MLEALNYTQLNSLVNTAISLVTAFVLGAVIGLERQYRQRTAGLRTNVLVAVGAAIFVDSANTIAGPDGAVRVMAYVVSGIGFLGAGVIMREEGNVRGLNTAATLWGSAAVGAAAGADLIVQAALGTVLVLAANTLLRPLVNAINRKPLDVASTEMTNAVFVVAERLHQRLALAMLQDVLERGGYPPGDIDIKPFGEAEVVIEATLAAQSVEGEELDAMVHLLAAKPGVRQAFWSPSTRD
ncbi:MgtC/SapB family protein [Comamonas sp. JUb58]|uniref:MgtC/SapB family protein n=1 Tax=Comamonas sp. JUb58 TaxID=2485114 RepID=UPI00105DBCF1|nr:MgtC/SapB family protein [Comamonas sp. JUb58]TDS74776.1 putative Mg2+ transporter-C (MgtC) family protein [Comamonas sp. JUb58]